MSLSSTSIIKQQILTQLGTEAANVYFEGLNKFVSGRASRAEFEDAIKAMLDSPGLIQLHNAFVISLFDSRSHKRHVSPPPQGGEAKPPPRKRRRVLPYQGPDTPEEDLTLRSTRLKRWTVSMGKSERERIRSLREPLPIELSAPRPREDSDEVFRERGIVLPKERAAPPGTHVGVPLAGHTRSLTVQLIAERMNLVCAQHNLGVPARMVSVLMHLACEVKLKQLITHALTLSSSSLAISSISSSPSPQTSHHGHPHPKLTTQAFEALFTLAPYDLPNKSAVAMRLTTLGENAEDEEGAGEVLGKREVGDERWQIMALLAERSTVREALKGVRV